MAIDRPIFIIGSGRSGTTVFYSLLATHPNVCWFSNYSDTFARAPFMPLLHRALGVPLLRDRIERNIVGASGSRFTVRPVEGDRIYHELCGFRHGERTTEADRDPEVERRFRRAIRRHLVLTGRRRFLSKQTANTQRLRLIDAIFPDARYVHVVRDGRAVACSLLNVVWWKDTDIWWLGKTPAQWEREGGDPIELCALHWRHDVEEIAACRDRLGDHCLEIRYEDLVGDVPGTMASVLEACGLEPSERFIDRLPRTLPNMNHKWREDLTDEQKETLQRVLGPTLERLGYTEKG